MSKILKKITKKYKWLRFLNYKTTKLAVLSAALFGLCLSSGASFAKYRDENYGNGAAGAAILNTMHLSYEYIPIAMPDILTSGGVFAFAASFSLSVEPSEVSYKFSLELRLAPADCSKFNFVQSEYPSFTHTTFHLNDDQEPVIKTFEDGQPVPTTVNSLSGTKSNYKKNAVYLASGETVDTLNWNDPTDSNTDDDIYGDATGIIKIENNYMVEATKSFTKHYKVLFFVNAIEGNNNFELENSKILYKLYVEQVISDE